MIFGYARISTIDQNPDLQIDDLKKAGCEKIFVDRVSGTVAERPQLSKLKELLRTGDTMVIWRLDRLGRSVPDLINWSDHLKSIGANLKSLKESIDTSTPTGRLVFNFFASLAEFERDLIVERTNAGLAASRERGRVGGRPRKIDKKGLDLVLTLYNQKKPIKEILSLAKISKSTLYSYLRESGRGTETR